MDWAAWLLKLLPNLLASISAPLRKSMVDFVKQFQEEAKKTDNPWDDFAAAVLAWLIGLDG